MNILVIAANGRTGRLVVEELLVSGHSVSVFIRINEESLFGKNVKVFNGDAMNYADMLKAVKSQDAIISTIGHVKGSEFNVQTVAVKNTIKAIEEHKQNTKLVSLTGNGVRQSGDKLFLIDRLMNWSIKLVDPDRINDGIKHVDVLKSSNINWSVIRVLKLSNSKPGKFTLTSSGPAKLLAPRSEVAKALVKLAEESKWDKQLPVISK